MSHAARHWSAPSIACAAIFSTLLAFFPQARAAQAQPSSSITIDDLLNEETLGDASFSPDGKWLMYVREWPVTRQPSWGYEDAGRLRARIFVARSDGSDVREVASASDVRYSPALQNPWSPDGRGLLLYANKADRYALAYYTLATGQITQLPGRILWPMDWMPDGTVVYSTPPDDQRQLDLNGPMLDHLADRWRAAWHANAPQVTVSSSSTVFPSAAKPEGALMLADPKTGNAQSLAQGAFLAMAASPDGRHIAAVKLAEEHSDALDRSGRRAELEIYAWDGKRARLRYHYGDVDVPLQGGLAWSPSGGRLLVLARPLHDAEGKALTYGRDQRRGMVLYEIALVDGKERVLSRDGLASDNLNDASVLPIGWIGERPIAIASHPSPGAQDGPVAPSMHSRLEYGLGRGLRFDVFAFDGAHGENLTSFAKTSIRQFLAPLHGDSAFVIDDGALWRVAPGRPPKRLSPEGPRIVGFGNEGHWTLAEDVRTAYYAQDGAERISLATLNGHSLGREVLDLRSGKITALSVPGDVAATAPDQLTTMSKDTVGWTSTLSLNRERAQVLATVNTGLNGKGVGQVEQFTYQYNGAPLIGWLILPPGAKPNEKLPAIVDVYGGSVYGDRPPIFTRTDLGFPIFCGQLMAAQGYAVVYPSTPLGQGSNSNLMTTLAGEVVAAIDALAAQGTIDPNRVGLKGQSFGGFSTAAILSARSDRFRAGVAMAGIYDFIGGYGVRRLETMLDDDSNMIASEIMMVESGQSQLGAPFWEATDAYIRNSPIFHVDKLDAPLLLLHGDLDMGVTGLSGAERMYNALLRAGKTATLVHYWGEGHVANDAWAIRDQFERMTAWFAYYVKGERPASMRKAQRAAPEQANARHA